MCGGTKYWQNASGEMVCEICHPDPNKDARRAQAMEILKERCRRGNQKLWAAWEEIKKLTPPGKEPWPSDEAKKHWQWELDKWDEAVQKLNELVNELNRDYGFEDCLYRDSTGKKTYNCIKDNPNGFWCVACPAKNSSLWANEMFGATVEKS